MIMGHLVAALCGTAKFRSGDHTLLLGEGGRRYDEAQYDALNPDAWRLGRIQRTEVWLLVLPATVNGEILGVPEWRYSLFLCYSIKPPGLPSHCGGCG